MNIDNMDPHELHELIKEQREIINEVYERVSEIHEIAYEAPELNMDNYTYDEVDCLNEAMNDTFVELDQLVATLKGYL